MTRIDPVDFTGDVQLWEEDNKIQISLSGAGLDKPYRTAIRSSGAMGQALSAHILDARLKRISEHLSPRLDLQVITCNSPEAMIAVHAPQSAVSGVDPADWTSVSVIDMAPWSSMDIMNKVATARHIAAAMQVMGWSADRFTCAADPLLADLATVHLYAVSPEHTRLFGGSTHLASPENVPVALVAHPKTVEQVDPLITTCAQTTTLVSPLINTSRLDDQSHNTLRQRCRNTQVRILRAVVAIPGKSEEWTLFPHSGRYLVALVQTSAGTHHLTGLKAFSTKGTWTAQDVTAQDIADMRTAAAQDLFALGSEAIISDDFAHSGADAKPNRIFAMMALALSLAGTSSIKQTECSARPGEYVRQISFFFKSHRLQLLVRVGATAVELKIMQDDSTNDVARQLLFSSTVLTGDVTGDRIEALIKYGVSQAQDLLESEW